MITLSLHAPEPWIASIVAASQRWPPGVRMANQHNGDVDGGAATVIAEVGDPDAPVTVFDPIEPGRARAIVWSREPMAPARITSWVWRCIRHAAPDVAVWDVPPDREEELRTPLPAGTTAVRTTRAAVSRMFERSSRVDDLVLAASELTANAVQHGRGPTILATVIGDDGVVMEVVDREPALGPFIVPMQPFASSGRGLAIVDVITDAWGVVVLPETKVVWCEFLNVRRVAAG